MFLSFLFSSCTTTKYIEKEVPVETVKIEYRNNIKRDSIYIHDSVSVYLKGDTIFQYKYRTLYKEKIVRDTVLVTDTIPKIVRINTTEIKEVNVLKWYQKALMVFGAACLISLIVYVYNTLKK